MHPLMLDFTYQGLPTRVISGPGTIHAIAKEIEAFDGQRVMIVSGPTTARSRSYYEIVQSLGARVGMLLDYVTPHSDTVMVDAAAGQARDRQIDLLLAIGGGSASDTAKAIAIVLAEGGSIEDHANEFTPPDRYVQRILPAAKLPIIVVPTTASAAEVTPGLGIRHPTGRKLLFWDTKLAPRLIVLDPKANCEVPAGVMATTAMNGFSHCVEGLYSRVRNPICDGIALHAIRLLAEAIPAMVAAPDDIEIRARVLVGAHLSGMVIANSRVGIHHAICHSLGSIGGLAHGVANSIMLPHAVAFNADIAAAQLAPVADALGVGGRALSAREATERAIEGIVALQCNARVPRRLREVGTRPRADPRYCESDPGRSRSLLQSKACCLRGTDPGDHRAGVVISVSVTF